MNDKISNLINIVKNGGNAGKETVVIPYSKLSTSILELLEKEGYVKSLEKKGKKINRFIEVGILYVNGNPRIQGVERVSKLSKRVYKKSSDIRVFRNGYGNLILSTTKGIMTDKMAKKSNIGGEVLFKIW